MHNRTHSPSWGRPFWPLVVLLIAAAAFYCAPLFSSLDAMGWQDWDQFTFRYDTPRLALLRDHQWPVWNPYADGGTVLLAHPHSPVLSPWYLLTLLTGAPLGLRLQVFVFMALGATGMAACVVRRLGGSAAAGALAGITCMMSAHYALHITEGHLEWTALGVMPWVAFAVWPREGRSRRSLVGAALLLASVLTLGAVYIPAIFLLFFTAWMGLEAMRARRLQPLSGWLVVILLTAGLSSAKLLPTWQFVSTHTRETDQAQRTSLRAALVGFTNPDPASLFAQYRGSKQPDLEFDPHGPLPIESIDYGFHEYGAYLGVVASLLIVPGVLMTWRQLWPLYGAGALCGWIALGSTSPVDLWAVVRGLPLYGQLQVPSRLLAAVIMTAAVAAALALDALTSLLPEGAASRWRPSLRWAATALLYAELVVMGHALFAQIFTIPALPTETHAQFAQRPPVPERATLVPQTMKSLLMPNLRANSGSVDGYENLSVPLGQVRTTDDPAYRGEVYLNDPVGTISAGTISDVQWTMARVRVRGQAPQASTLVMNQNYAPGWTTTRSASADAPATPTPDGLISTTVDAGPFDVEFRYWPPGLTVGLWISLLTLVGCVVGLRRW